VTVFLEIFWIENEAGNVTKKYITILSTTDDQILKKLTVIDRNKKISRIYFIIKNVHIFKSVQKIKKSNSKSICLVSIGILKCLNHFLFQNGSRILSLMIKVLKRTVQY